MKFNQAILLPALLLIPAAGCGSQRHCEPIPGQSHSYPPSPTHGYASAGVRGTAPGPDWMWLEGCWYWNGSDWAWLETQWMPPGGQMSYVGPADSGRDDYCVFQPGPQYVLPVAMPWPPAIGVGIGYSVQEVVVRGDYGSRGPGGWDGGGTGRVRDHRNESPTRGNEVVPAHRGGAVGPERDFDDNPYLGTGPVARPTPTPPAPSPPSPRPSAPPVGPAAPPSPPIVSAPPRPSAPPAGPAMPPPDRVRHDPPPVQAPPPSRPTPPPTPPPPAPRPAPPVTRPSAPAPAPARPAPPPSAAPKPAPPPPAARPAAPARPSTPRDRGPARGRQR